MLYKQCPSCEKLSYSASPESNWLCPYCGKDLNSLKAMPVGKELQEKDRQQSNSNK